MPNTTIAPNAYLSTRALAAARRALATEHDEGADDVDARICGVLACQAGLDLDTLYTLIPGIAESGMWSAIVDGYCDESGEY